MPSIMGRKKKSYIHHEDDEARSSERRELIKRKLYADHMMGDEVQCDYLLRRQASTSMSPHYLPGRNSSFDRTRALSRTKSLNVPKGQDRSITGYSPLRNPVKRSFSDSHSRKDRSASSLRHSKESIHPSYSEESVLTKPSRSRSRSSGRRMSMSGNMESIHDGEMSLNDEHRGRSQFRRSAPTEDECDQLEKREKPKRRLSITATYTPSEPKPNGAIPTGRPRSLSIGSLSSDAASLEQPSRRASLTPTYGAPDLVSVDTVPRCRRRSLSIGRLSTAKATKGCVDESTGEKTKRRFSLSPGRFRRKTQSTRNGDNEHSDTSTSPSLSRRRIAGKRQMSPYASKRPPNLRGNSKYQSMDQDESLADSSSDTSSCWRGQTFSYSPGNSVGHTRNNCDYSVENTVTTLNSSTRYSNTASEDSQSSWETNSQNSHPLSSPTALKTLSISGRTVLKADDNRREEIYNRALRRAKERQAMKQANPKKNHPEHAKVATGQKSLHDSLVALRNDNAGEAQGEEEDDTSKHTEDKSIFSIASRLLGAVENIYDECS